MKLKDLIFNREKLRKYDELKEWKERFETAIFDVSVFECANPRIFAGNYVMIPDHIKQIIVDALQTEIAKLDEE